MKNLSHSLGSVLALGALSTVLAMPALAQSQGDWTFGVGIINVNPKSDNGSLAGAAATVGDDTQLSLTGEYFILDNLGIELLAATPFEHSISLGGAEIGSTKHLPPTVSLVYHVPTRGKVTPFFGVGLNYTTFFEETTALGDLELDDSFGLAATIGADWQISEHGSLRLNVRYMDIETDATLNGAPIGTAEIDPVSVGVSYVHRF
ncbi:OmpW/AlkL family protein [Heliomarina baculiformis]|uniref:OmpW/AlkL family protein n=1 Tax=Heliomarina baculiformis TaxID=2872036 RepID=UPI001EE16970|nr:OmpW family outer membrane protein [Heliomarina baculiformis]